MSRPLLGASDDPIHQWDEAEQDCPITFGEGKSHGKHFMRCSRCGTRRLGAFAEQGCYHYFSYVHPDGRESEVMPPCTIMSEDYTAGEVLECGKCHHLVADREKGCEYKCGAPIIALQGVFKKD